MRLNLVESKSREWRSSLIGLNYGTHEPIVARINTALANRRDSMHLRDLNCIRRSSTSITGQILEAASVERITIGLPKAASSNVF